MLRVTVHDEPRDVTFQVEGMLAGPWVQELDKCWRSALARRPEPIVSVDLTGVTFIDEAGKSCLEALHRLGAEFIATDCVTKDLLAEITHSAEKVENDPGGGSSGSEK